MYQDSAKIYRDIKKHCFDPIFKCLELEQTSEIM